MSFAKRLGLTDHVLPKLAQCLALLEATGTALRVVAVGSNGEPVSLTAAPSWSPEQPLLHGEPSDLL